MVQTTIDIVGRQCVRIVRFLSFLSNTECKDVIMKPLMKKYWQRAKRNTVQKFAEKKLNLFVYNKCKTSEHMAAVGETSAV